MQRTYQLFSLLGGIVIVSTQPIDMVFAKGYPPQQLPDMQMHVFGQTQPPVSVPAAAPVRPVAAGEPQLNMVVFSPGTAAAAQPSPAAHAASDNLRLTYNDDGQVQVAREYPEQDIHTPAPVQQPRTVKDAYAFLYEIKWGLHLAVPSTTCSN